MNTKTKGIMKKVKGESVVDDVFSATFEHDGKIVTWDITLAYDGKEYIDTDGTQLIIDEAGVKQDMVMVMDTDTDVEITGVELQSLLTDKLRDIIFLAFDQCVEDFADKDMLLRVEQHDDMIRRRDEQWLWNDHNRSVL